MANEYGAQEQKKFDWYQTMTNTVIEHLESGADFLTIWIWCQSRSMVLLAKVMILTAICCS